MFQIQIGCNPAPREAPPVDKPRVFEGLAHHVSDLILPSDKNLDTFPSVIVLSGATEAQGPVLQHLQDNTGICVGDSVLKDAEEKRVPHKQDVMCNPVISRLLSAFRRADHGEFLLYGVCDPLNILVRRLPPS